MIFLGYTFSALIFPRLSDVIGRKKTFCSGFLLHIAGLIIILYVPYRFAIYLGLFLVGVASTVRTAVGYVYSLEFIQIDK